VGDGVAVALGVAEKYGVTELPGVGESVGVASSVGLGVIVPRELSFGSSEELGGGVPLSVMKIGASPKMFESAWPLL
jgi:hypothetical protein